MSYNCLFFWQQVICFKSLNLGQVTSKYSERLYLCLNNCHCNLNSKSNPLFNNLNIIKCTLGCRYITAKLYLLQTYPKNHCSKAKILLTLHSNSSDVKKSTLRCIWEYQKGWITSRQMKLVRKLKKKKLEVTKLKRYQNLFRTISIRKDLQSLKVEGSMDK